MNKSVFKVKRECCGCGACINICPKKAIQMKKDEYGFEYPEIDKSKCINCKLCEKVCLYKNNLKLNEPIGCYAGLAKDNDICYNSASGGIFYVVALECIKKGFVLYGSFMEFKNSKPVVKHIKVEKQDDLKKLQGSKYVQSDITKVFESVKTDLVNDKKVLFSGTPCQVQAIKNYLSVMKVNTDNFYSIDIICHGVPSLAFFNSYIDSLYKDSKKIDFKFRDKLEGWGLMGSITIEKNNKVIKKRIYPKTSSYYYLFLNTDIYRDSCYTCNFSTKKRVGDITLGDYWGIEKLHPEYLKNNGGKLDNQNGISCVLINSDKGKELFESASKKILFENSSFDNIAKYNHNLNEPSHIGNNRDVVLKLFKNNNDFSNINKWYKKKLGIKYYLYTLWIKLPYVIRKKIRNMINK